MNIINKDDQREIKQLWCIASYYFQLAQKIENGLQNKDLLKKAVKDVADLCSTPCNNNLSKCNNNEIMLLNAHLASCAIRLHSIDEILGKKYTSIRWYFYNGLLDKRSRLETDDIKTNANKIVHLLLRHAVAHYEPDLPQNHQFQIIDTVFKTFSIEETYKNIELVMEEIKKDIYPVIK